MSCCWSSRNKSSWWSFNRSCWWSSRWWSSWSSKRCPVFGHSEDSTVDDLPKDVLLMVLHEMVRLMIFQKVSSCWSISRWSSWWSSNRYQVVGLLVNVILLFCQLQIFANVLLISNGSLVDVTLDVHLPVVLCPVGSQPELPLIFSYLIVHQQIRNAPVTSSPPNTASCLLLKMMISTIKYLSFSLQINYSNQCCSPAGNVCDLVDIHDGSSLAFCK